MESLVLLATLIGLPVLLVGPAAALLTWRGFVYLGAIVGLVAVTIGMWWVRHVHWQAGIVGWLSAGLGLWSVLQGWRQHAAQ